MDGALSFLEKWVVRPVSILGALLTLYFAAIAVANGDLALVARHFGVPDFSLALPDYTVPQLGPPPEWLADIWRNDMVRLTAIIALLGVMCASAFALGWALSFLGPLGAVILAPGLLFGVWVWLRQVTAWFSDLPTTVRYDYAIGHDGAISWTASDPIAAIGGWCIAAAVALGVAAGAGFARDRSEGLPLVLAWVLIGVAGYGGSRLVDAEFQRFEKVAEGQPALEACSATFKTQVNSHGSALRSLIAANSSPRPHDKGPLASAAFLPGWYGFIHACARAPGDPEFNRFRLLVSYAARGDGKVRCSLAAIEGARTPAGVRFERYSFVQTFVGSDCDSYHDGMIALAVRQYATEDQLRAVFTQPLAKTSASPPTKS